MWFIFWYDYVAAPFYILVLVGLLLNYFNRRHRHEPELKTYFVRGLVFKIIGCLAIGLIYEHYYNGRYDGYNYFYSGMELGHYLGRHPGEILHVLTHDIKDFTFTNLDGIDLTTYFVYSEESFFMAKLVAVFNFVCFDMFLPISLLFCTFAFLAVWNFFIFVRREFGIRNNLAAYCSLFIPSVLVWDSSVFKDTVTFSALCWLLVTGYYVFVKPRRVYMNIFGFLVAAYLILQVKVYIFAAFVPFFLLFVFNSYKHRITNPTVRFLATPFILVTAAAAIGLFLSNADQLLGRYSVENALETAAGTYSNITQYGGAAGSSYDLNVDFSSPIGVLLAIPQGINLTLFRPYPWEYAKVIIFLASIESMFVLFFTLRLVFRNGISSTVKLVASTPILQFCLLFTALFAFMTGIAAANFGTLVRYKIPCLPFYLLFLVYLHQKKILEPREELEALEKEEWAKRLAQQNRLSGDIPLHSS